jgi:hypothetical protein
VRLYRFHLDAKGKVLETPEELVAGFSFQTSTVVYFATEDGVVHYYPWASLHHVEMVEVEEQREEVIDDERGQDSGQKGPGGAEPGGLGEAVEA